MKKEVISKKTFYTCDQCGKTSESGKDWYAIESLEDESTRLWEKSVKRKDTRLKTYTNRKELHFCSKECITRYLQHSVQLFISEMRPPKNRNSVEMFDV